jgi:YebC/PmpR family DNA-binding regulatory protein
MSGHSKWSTIKRKKGLTDSARAKEFTKIARIITVAAQNGGGDPDMNPSLALGINKARSANMPNDNVERAIKKGIGAATGAVKIEEISYEGYGPANVAIIIDCMTDNRNRTVGELKSKIEKLGGRIAEIGSVAWQFKTIGRILLEIETPEEKNIRDNAKWNSKVEAHKIPKDAVEEFQLELMDLPGILDIAVADEGVEIETEYAELHNVRKFIEQKGFKIADAGLVKVSASTIELTEEDVEKVEKFIEQVEEIDDVQQVWTNVG